MNIIRISWESPAGHNQTNPGKHHYFITGEINLWWVIQLLTYQTISCLSFNTCPNKFWEQEYLVGGFNPYEKYEFVNGKDDNPYEMENKSTLW